MRIAYLINQYPKISHSFVRREILALEGQGFEIMRIALRGWNQTLVDREDEAERARSRYVLQAGTRALMVATAHMLLIRPMRFAQALLLAWRMSRHADRPLSVHLIYLAEACRIEPWLSKAKIQHLHAHFGTNSAEVAMLIRVLGGPQWSFTVHGPEEFDRAPLIGLVEKVRRCAFVVAVSSYGRSQLYRLAEYAHWPKIQVVHCGLDSHFAAAPASPSSSARRLICLGRLCEQKGQLLLIEAARRLAADGADFELVFAGDGELRGEIESLITRYKLGAKVRVLGWISGDKVREEIIASRALVLPSFAEGLPVVLMEAMALRRPVISTYIAGIPELVRAGEHGWLVPAGDVEALVDAMGACLGASADMLTRMGDAARERASARHNVQREARKLGKLFQSCILIDTAVDSQHLRPGQQDGDR
jgi:colanic acid/amylovoran biosynthesis glycosyltransferase